MVKSLLSLVDRRKEEDDDVVVVDDDDDDDDEDDEDDVVAMGCCFDGTPKFNATRNNALSSPTLPGKTT